MMSALLLLFLSGPPGCQRDSDCRRPGTACGCDVRLNCKYLAPGTLFGKPRTAACLTASDAIDAGAVIASGRYGGACSWPDCVLETPPCRDDKQCPADHVCVCRQPGCTVQMRTIPEGDARKYPPYSTYMCLPKSEIDAGYSY